MGWFDRWRGADFDAITPPKLVRPTQTTVTWRDDGAGGFISSDDYWHVRRVTSYHLQRQGVDLGAYPDREQAQARAELDDTVRPVCRGSRVPPWRVDQESQHGECVVCSGWWPLEQGRIAVHPTFREAERCR